MHSGDEIPRVNPETTLPDVIYEISKKKMGHTAVVDADGRLAGVISDGDLRRFSARRQPRARPLRGRPDDAHSCVHWAQGTGHARSERHGKPADHFIDGVGPGRSPRRRGPHPRPVADRDVLSPATSTRVFVLRCPLSGPEAFCEGSETKTSIQVRLTQEPKRQEVSAGLQDFRRNMPLNLQQVRRRARKIKLLLLDVDGVMTDGRIYYVPRPEGGMFETKPSIRATASASATRARRESGLASSAGAGQTRCAIVPRSLSWILSKKTA